MFKVLNKTAASAAQLAKCICFMLINIQLQLPAARAQTKTSLLLIERVGITVFLVVN